MKRVTLPLLLLVSIACRAQSDLPTVPAIENINLRLEAASEQLTNAADTHDAAIYSALVGSALAIVAYRHNPEGAIGIGVATVGVVCGFSITSSGYTRKAARALHQ